MTQTTTPTSLIIGIAQVKLPVTDLARSVAWYRDVLDLRFWTEFVEEGEVRGAGLIDRDARFNVALRCRDHCANHPDLTGFDVVAFTPRSRAALDLLTQRCDRLGVAHGPIVEGPEGARLDIPDPDGTVLRFYHFTAPTSGFTGIVLNDGRLVETYERSRLEV
ncbi:VOC family protein [Gordonia sp. CPCC 205515]|uniref:VOC family protein n=1 Tax=Gordonia sp. CPCC 205515 TaxID=3140791 RepID=UPI003AF38BF7